MTAPRNPALAVALAAVLLVIAAQPAARGEEGDADAEWIARQGRRNAAGEYCCGRADCYVVPSEFVRITAAGYRLMPAGAENETVPYREAQVSPDGRYWR